MSPHHLFYLLVKWPVGLPPPMGDCPSTCRQSVARVAVWATSHKKQDVAKMSFLRFKVNLKSLSSVLADDEFRDASPLAAVFFGRFFSFSFFLTTLVHKESRLTPKIASFVAPCGSSTTLRCAAKVSCPHPPPHRAPVPCMGPNARALHACQPFPALYGFRPRASYSLPACVLF